MQKKINQLKKEIENILNDNKALEVKSINLKGKTSIADFMIIASGNSSKHIQALSEILLDELKKRGISNCRLEGRSSNDWKKIPKLAKIVVFPRQNYPIKSTKLIASKKLNKKDLIHIKSKKINISSSLIRKFW